jgi:hypothetical protein
MKAVPSVCNEDPNQNNCSKLQYALVMVLFKNFGVQKLGFQNNSSSL